MKKISNFKKGFIAVMASFLAVSIIEIVGTLIFREGVSPITMLGLRAIIATLLFGLTVAISKKISFKIDKKDILRLLLHSSILVIHLLLFWYGLKAVAHIPTVLSFCITFPIWAAIISIIFLKEHFSINKFFSILLGGFGTLFVVGFLPALSFKYVNVAGISLISISAIAWAIFWIIGRKLAKKYNIFTILFYNFLFSAIAFTIIATPSTMISQLSVRVLWYIALVSIVSTYINYSLYAYGLKFIKLSTATIISLARPIVSVSLAFLILSQFLTFWQVVGTVLIVSGTYLLFRENKDK